MIGDWVGQVETAKPAIGQVEMHFLTEPALRPNAMRISNDQHADHQLWVDRRPPGRAVVRRQVGANSRQVHETVNRSEQVVRRNMTFKRKLVEQGALRLFPRPHHRR